MFFIPIRRKWKRTLSETKKYCVVHHVFGKWYIVRNLLKDSPKRKYFRAKHFFVEIHLVGCE